MSKTITIPDLGMDPVKVIVNGKKYEYRVGDTVTLPDAVADVIDHADDCYLAPAKEADSRSASIGDVKKLIAEAIAAIPAPEPEPAVELTELVSVTLGSSDTNDVPEGMCSAQADLTGAQISSIMGARGDLYLNDAQHELMKQTGSEGELVLLWNMTFDDGTIALAPGATTGYCVIVAAEQSAGVLIVISTEDVGHATVTILAAPADPTAPVVIDLSGDDSPATFDEGIYTIDDAATSNAIYHAIISGKPVWVQHEIDGVETTSLVYEYWIDESGTDDLFVAIFSTSASDLALHLIDFEDPEEDDHILPTDPGASVTVILPSQS